VLTLGLSGIAGHVQWNDITQRDLVGDSEVKLFVLLDVCIVGIRDVTQLHLRAVQNIL